LNVFFTVSPANTGQLSYKEKTTSMMRQEFDVIHKTKQTAMISH
jgi:hypothetical protein